MDFDGFRTEKPDPNLKPDYSERFHIAGYTRIQQEEGYKFYQQWIAPGFPRFLIVEIQHANPYYVCYAGSGIGDTMPGPGLFRVK